MVGPEKSDQKFGNRSGIVREFPKSGRFGRFFKDSEAVNIKGPSCPTVGQLLEGFGVISSIRGHFGPLFQEIGQMGHTFWRFSRFLEKTVKKWSEKEGLCP